MPGIASTSRLSRANKGPSRAVLPTVEVAPRAPSKQAAVQPKTVEVDTATRAGIGIQRTRSKAAKPQAAKLDSGIRSLLGRNESTKKTSPPSKANVQVLVKLSRGGTYATIPPSNKPGNERAKAFTREVAEVADRAGMTVVMEAANVGVATVEGPPEGVGKLIRSPMVVAAKLVRR